MYKQIAKITSVRLGLNDRTEHLTAEIWVDYGGLSQMVGGYALSQCDPETDESRAIPVAGDFILGVLRACGVDDWSKLVGRTIYVLFEKEPPKFGDSRPLGIENLPTEEGEPFLFATWQKQASRGLASSSTHKQEHKPRFHHKHGFWAWVGCSCGYRPPVDRRDSEELLVLHFATMGADHTTVDTDLPPLP